MFISATFRILSVHILLFILQKKIRIEFSANYPLTTFRIPQSASTKYPFPNSVVDVCTVNAFKACLDKFLQHQALKFDFTADLTGIGNRSEDVIK